MKTFSILLTLVCIGFVLMLAGNSDAQRKVQFEAETEEVVKVESEKLFEIDGTTTLTITLKIDDEVADGQPVIFRVLGFVADDDKRVLKEDPTVAEVSNPSGNTDDNGQIETMVTFRKAGRIGIEANATALGSLYVHVFNVKGDPEPPQPDPPAPPQPRLIATPDVGAGLKVGDTFAYTIEVQDLENLAAYQMDIVFNPNVLEAGAVTEGEYLKRDGWNTFFHTGSGGKISLSSTRINQTQDANGDETQDANGDEVGGVDSDSRTLATIEFTLLEFAEEAIGLHNVQLSDSEGNRISYATLVHPVVTTHMFPAEDVNRDGTVNVLDLTVVAGSLGQANPINPRADVNNDSIVNALDLVMVAQKLGTSTPAVKVRDANAAAPAANAGNLRPETVQGWIDIARVEDDGSAIFDLGIANLEQLLQATVPEKTKLLLNYPNPFNPETWIPYQLATATDVTVSIYSVNGTLVRTLALGHQAAGVYQSKSQAAYWDGRNELGEQVASGVYFYTLTAGDFSATGKMLVRK